MAANYLTFQSSSSFTLNIYDNTKHWNGTLYYSTDTTNWNTWGGTTTLSSVDNKLYLRGTGNTVITGNDQSYRWVLTGSNIKCTGNIESLLDWEAVESGNHPSMTSYCYAYLFYGCANLTSPPALPATTLADYCYACMFYGCTALTLPPALPATTLADFCYSAMFSGCTALASAPALPATTLASGCYANMFYSCTSLASAPALPATTLASYCYTDMFHRCTALTSPPALPATTLANHCYSHMFARCEALVSVPALRATTLATYCYNNMFSECTSLKISSTQTGAYQYEWRIPTSGTGTASDEWNSDMLSGTGGTFTSNPSIDTTYYVENPPVSGFNITFEENGGTTQTDLTGQTVLPTPLPTPTKSGYKFVAWYYESNFQTRAKAGDTIESNVTLYAKWHNLGSLFTEIANAIRGQDGTRENIRDVDFGERIAELPSTAGGSIFTGATIPLTYKNNTHDYENNYEYKSATHNITITGLDGRATITGNGTKNVLVAFDVTSSTTSLKNFTITCVNKKQELTYKGLHAHYGETVTGILTFAYNNITHDGSEGTFDTSGLTANYKFIVTSSSDLPIFSSDEV